MEKKEKYTSYDSANTFFWSVWTPQLVSILVVISFSIIAVILDITTDILYDNLIVQIICLMVAQIAFIGYFIVYNKKNNVSVLKAVKLSKKVNIFGILIAVAIALALVFLTSPIISLIDFLLLKINFVKDNTLPIALNSVPMLILGIVILAVLPAVVEEVIFRGMVTSGLINSVKTNKGKVLAIVFSALIFAGIHLSLQQFVYPLIVGLVLGFVFLITKNLLYTMIIHFVSNCVVVVNSYLTYGQEMENSFTVTNGFAAFGFLVLAFVVVFGLMLLLNYVINKKWKIIDKKEQDEVEIIAPTEEISDNLIKEKALIDNAKIQLKEKEKLVYWVAAASAVILIISDFITYTKKG